MNCKQIRVQGVVDVIMKGFKVHDYGGLEYRDKE